MCGIIGLYNDPRAGARLAKGMAMIANRGQDHYAIMTARETSSSKHFSGISNKEFENASSALGHCLHAVVSYREQPFAGRGKLIANCEIYNWEELAANEGLLAQNDAELVFSLLEKSDPAAFEGVIRGLDGDYALAYERDSRVYLFRDPVGIKPIWYAHANGSFAFASEAKALYAMGFETVFEQNPREYMVYDTATDTLSRTHGSGFEETGAATVPDPLDALEKTFLAAVRKRIPNVPFGILFSGGIDSVVLAAACQKLGHAPMLFHATIVDESLPAPSDLAFAQRAAHALGLPLHVVSTNLLETKERLPLLVPLLETSDVIKTGIGLTLYAACEAAQKKGIKVLLSGLGADELFGGYQRSQAMPNRLADETRSYLRRAYEKDLYINDLVSMQNTVELRVPYYDLGLIGFALALDDSHKIQGDVRKKILRDLATRWGIPTELAQRPKKASQYASNADRALERLAKTAGYPSKSAYLRAYWPRPNQRLGALISGGKDSWLAATILAEKNYEVTCLVTLASQNPDSFMFHTPAIQLVETQSRASGIPLVIQPTAGTAEDELADLKTALQTAQTRYGIQGVVNGALFSDYQRRRIEKACDELGLKTYSPLWHTPQDQEIAELVSRGFEVVFSGIACAGLDKEWLGQRLTPERIVELTKLHNRFGINVAGEGGEYESLVLDCGLFKQKIELAESHAVMRNDHTGRLEITAARLVPKD
jgi:asparagine synthase (glutamine-hydrolysing)